MINSAASCKVKTTKKKGMGAVTYEKLRIAQ
jgi:hypothetical protein